MMKNLTIFCGVEGSVSYLVFKASYSILTFVTNTEEAPNQVDDVRK